VRHLVFGCGVVGGGASLVVSSGGVSAIQAGGEREVGREREGDPKEERSFVATDAT